MPIKISINSLYYRNDKLIQKSTWKYKVYRIIKALLKMMAVITRLKTI